MIVLNNLLKYTMGLVKLQKIMLIGFVYFLHNGSFAVGLDEVMVLAADHAQSITIEPPINYDSLSSDDSLMRNTVWTIKSNNAVTIDFSGSSPEGSEATNIPRFYKQKVDAKDRLIYEKYDYLDTRFGANLDNIDSTERGSTSFGRSTWGGGDSPNTSSELLIDKTNSLSPNGYWGAIMPSDANDFSLTLYSKGTGNVSTQSGIYTLYLSLHVTAEEVLNP